MGKDNDGFKFTGPLDDFFHLKPGGAHDIITHMGYHVFAVKGFKLIQKVKIDQDMGSLRRCHFDARYAQNISVLSNFDGTTNFVVIGYSDANAQVPNLLDDALDRIMAIRIVGMKVQIHYGIFFT
jgi:hypothetical protein